MSGLEFLDRSSLVEEELAMEVVEDLVAAAVGIRTAGGCMDSSPRPVMTSQFSVRQRAHCLSSLVHPNLPSNILQERPNW